MCIRDSDYLVRRILLVLLQKKPKIRPPEFVWSSVTDEKRMSISSIVRFKSESSNFNPSYVEFSPRHDPFCSTDLNSMDKSTHVTFFLMRDSPWKMGFTTCASIFPPHLNPTRDHLPIQDSMFDFNELQRVVASHLLRIWRHANGESCALGRPRYDAASNAHELLSKMKSYCACNMHSCVGKWFLVGLR